MLTTVGGNGGGGGAAQQDKARQEASTSFLKKRSKRLLFSGQVHDRGIGRRVKVFWFFFSKKNILALLP
jgi:hypothetical protein